MVPRGRPAYPGGGGSAGAVFSGCRGYNCASFWVVLEVWRAQRERGRGLSFWHAGATGVPLVGIVP